MVQDIEHLGTELELHGLRHWKQLHQSEIELFEAVGEKNIAAAVAIGELGRRGKCAGSLRSERRTCRICGYVKPTIRLTDNERSADHLGTLAANSRIGHIVADGRRKRQAGAERHDTGHAPTTDQLIDESMRGAKELAAFPDRQRVIEAAGKGLCHVLAAAP